MHVLARVGEERTGAAVEATAVDEQRLVAIIERRPLDLVLREVKLGNAVGDPVEELQAVGVGTIHSRSLSGAPGGTVDRLLLPQPGVSDFEFPARRYGITIVNPTVLLSSAGPDTVALF